MIRTRSVRAAMGLLVGTLLLLAGCQLFDTRRSSSLLNTASEPTPKLKSGQVADVKIAFARSLEERGQFEQAELAYREALKADPRRADALVHLATLRDRQGKFTESGELYRKALALKPGNADIFCNLGYSCYLQRRWPEAEMNLKQAIAVRPDHRLAHNNLGLVLAQTDRPQEALIEFQKAGCSEADAHNNLAFGLAVQRRWLEAREEYALAVRLDPSLASAKKALAQVTALASKGDHAVAVAEAPPLQAAPWTPTAEPMPGAFGNGDPAAQQTSDAPAIRQAAYQAPATRGR